MLDVTGTGSSQPAIVPVQPDAAKRAFETLTRTFAGDPPSRWLFPEEQVYRRCFPAFAEAFGGAAIAGGTALAVDGLPGVALWLAPGAGPDEEGLVRLVEESLPERRRAGALAVFEEMGRVHPTEPHWYLPLVGVEPECQGKGLGAALLRPVLHRCDAAGLPAYLESTNPRNRHLYERLGFAAAGEIRVADCPPIVPMWRCPTVQTLADVAAPKDPISGNLR